MPIASLLRGVDVFANLAPDDLAQIAQRTQERHLLARDVLFRQDGPADCLFVVTSGSVELSKTAPESGGAQLVGEGQACGDVALFSGERHSATATALADSTVLVLHKDDFETLVASRPWIMRTMLAAISRRIAHVNRELVTEQQSSEELLSANGHVIAVFSPRGGSGKTTLAINLALELAAAHPGEVALFDLDLLFDDAAFLLHVSPTTSLGSIAERDLSQLDRRMRGALLAEHDSQLRVLVAATRPEDGERVTGAHVRAALSALKRQFAITVVDCGNSLGEPTLVPLEMANRVVVVCTPDLASLRDVRDCQRIFGQAFHLDRQRLTYCFNHPLPVAGLTRAQFESALEQPLAVDIPHAGDSATRAAATAGTCVRPAGRAPFGRAIERLVKEVQPTELPAPVGTRRAPAGAGRFPRLFWRHAHL